MRQFITALGLVGLMMLTACAPDLALTTAVNLWTLTHERDKQQ